MRVFYLKEARGQHAAARFVNNKGPVETVALFRKEVDARRFVDAANRSMDLEEEKQAAAKRTDADRQARADQLLVVGGHHVG